MDEIIAKLRAAFAWRIRLLRQRFPGRVGAFKLVEKRYLKWVSQRPESPRQDKGPILFLTLRGWPAHVVVEAFSALRLLSRGECVHFVTSDDDIPFCESGMEGQFSEDPDRLRRSRHTKDVFFRSIYPTHTIALGEIDESAAAAIEALDLPAAEAFVYEDIQLGRCCLPGLVWWLRRSVLTAEDLPLLKDMLRVAVATVAACEGLFQELSPVCVVMFNGHFYTERVAAAVASKHGVRFVTHDFSFEERLVAGHNHAAWDHEAISPTEDWRQGVDDTCREKGAAVLKEWRESHGYQGDLWHRDVLETCGEISQLLGLTESPVAVAYTNLPFESSVACKDRTFVGQLEWLLFLVDLFRTRPDWQLVIRIHPAEQRKDDWGTREYIGERLVESVAEFPLNVHLVAAADKISSYALLDLARCCLVYSSTIGMEAVDRGVRTVTAAHVHYAHRGFTNDPLSPEEYRDLLSRAMNDEESISEESRQLLVEYLGWFLQKRLLDFELVKIHPASRLPLVPDVKGSAFFSGRLQGLERFCDLIASGREWWHRV